MSRTLHLFGTDWGAMMVSFQVIRWYRFADTVNLPPPVAMSQMWSPGVACSLKIASTCSLSCSLYDFAIILIDFLKIWGKSN